MNRDDHRARLSQRTEGAPDPTATADPTAAEPSADETFDGEPFEDEPFDDEAFDDEASDDVPARPVRLGAAWRLPVILAAAELDDDADPR